MERREENKNCDGCGKKFASKRSLYQHKRNWCTGRVLKVKKDIFCDGCERKFC